MDDGDLRLVVGVHVDVDLLHARAVQKSAQGAGKKHQGVVLCGALGRVGLAVGGVVERVDLDGGVLVLLVPDEQARRIQLLRELLERGRASLLLPHLLGVEEVQGDLPCQSEGRRPRHGPPCRGLGLAHAGDRGGAGLHCVQALLLQALQDVVLICLSPSSFSLLPSPSPQEHKHKLFSSSFLMVL